MLLPTTASDHALIPAHVLNDLSAEVFPLGGVSWAFFDELRRLRIVRFVREKEWVPALPFLGGGAHVALDSSHTCGNKGENEEDGRREEHEL